MRFVDASLRRVTEMHIVLYTCLCSKCALYVLTLFPGADAPPLARLVIPLCLYTDALVLMLTMQSGLPQVMDCLDRFVKIED